MSLSPFADLRGLPYHDDPSLHMNLAGQLWAWEREGSLREVLPHASLDVDQAEIG